MDTGMIKKVFVVYKTHLDIGFTDMGQTVLDRYVGEYIPHSIDLAEAMNTDTDKKFIWTVGSYLIDYFYKHGTEAYCKKLTRAIERGDICWHGLACTTHTELMDQDLLNFDLSISNALDQKFGKHTIAAKMTDVPGHTKAIIQTMYNHGIRYMHIGVNASSMVPGVPMTFVWKDGEAEIVVQYSAEYGAPCYAEGMEEVLEFAHTADNMGPQSEEAVSAEMSRIQKKYPNAQVVAATMDDYAACLLKVKDRLPVIEEEIGDTWIHGIASDPLKVMQLKALIHLKNQWKEKGIFHIEDEKFRDFLMNLMLIAEHTWGLDFKKYLADFTNWTKEDFMKARAEDATTLDFLTNRNAQMLGVLQEDFKKYRGGKFTGSYAFYERAHAEQRAYIEQAVNALPDDLKKEAVKALEVLDEMRHGQGTQPEDGQEVHPYEKICLNGWTTAFDGTGAMVCLKKNGKDWLDGRNFGRLVYTIYSAKDCVNNYYSYNRAFKETECWSEGDFSKPALEFVEDLEHRDYIYGVRSIKRSADTVTIMLAADMQASEKYSAPRKASVTYIFGDSVKCLLNWQDKDPGKIPEALWFEMNFKTENPYMWKLEKMGEMIDPMKVLCGGNRRQHCVESVDYAGADGKMNVTSVHAPLVSVGGRWLYGDYRPQPDIAQGFAWCLFNNKWGTNFKMWCEDDCAFEFEIELQDY